MSSLCRSYGGADAGRVAQLKDDVNQVHSKCVRARARTHNTHTHTAHAHTVGMRDPIFLRNNYTRSDTVLIAF